MKKVPGNFNPHTCRSPSCEKVVDSLNIYWIPDIFVFKPQKVLFFSGTPTGAFFRRSERINDAKRSRQDSSGVDKVYMCHKCDKQIEEGINCVGCKLVFCFNGVGINISRALYNYLLNREYKIRSRGGGVSRA